MGIISSALAAAGDAGVQSMNQNIAQMQQMNLDQARSDLETQKQKALLDYQNTLQNAPTNRAGALLREGTVDQVLDKAPQIAQLSGDLQNEDGTVSHGVAGNYDDLKAKLSQIQDPNDRAAALDQLNRQFQTDVDTAQAGRELRNRTPEEALAYAMDQAKSRGDLQALVALKTAVGDKLMILPDGGTLFDTTTGKVVASSSSNKDERLDKQIAARNALESQREDARAALIAGGNKDSPFIKELKSMYPEGSPEYKAALKARIDRESGSVDPSTIEANAQAVAAGKQDPPNLNSRSPQNAAIMKRVYEINPEYNKRLQVAAQKSANSFASGPDGATVSSFNATAEHLTMLKDAADALKNGNIQVFNQIGNAYAKATGSAAPTNLATVSQLVAGEIVKAVTAGNGALGDREGLEKNLQSKLSPDQLDGTIDTYNGMIAAQINAKYQKYNSNIPAFVNNPELSDFARFLSPKVRAMTGINPPAGAGANWGGTTVSQIPGPSKATVPNPIQDNGLPTGWSVKVH